MFGHGSLIFRKTAAFNFFSQPVNFNFKMWASALNLSLFCMLIMTISRQVQKGCEKLKWQIYHTKWLIYCDLSHFTSLYFVDDLSSATECSDNDSEDTDSHELGEYIACRNCTAASKLPIIIMATSPESVMFVMYSRFIAHAE